MTELQHAKDMERPASAESEMENQKNTKMDGGKSQTIDATVDNSAKSEKYRIPPRTSWRRGEVPVNRVLEAWGLERPPEMVHEYSSAVPQVVDDKLFGGLSILRFDILKLMSSTFVVVFLLYFVNFVYNDM